MEIYGDYHTHTIYSHGKGTIIDNVVAARKKGLKEIAITDHGMRHFAFGVSLKKLIKMREEIDRINANISGIKVLLGMECNIISTEGDIDINDSISKYLDILLVGYHMMVLPKGLKDVINIYGKNYIARLLPAVASEVKDANTEAIIRALKKYKIDIITHPGARIPIDTRRLAHEAAKVGTALEINSKCSSLTTEYVREAAKEAVKFVINSDAHSPENVGNVDKGIKIALDAGLDRNQIINAVKYS